MTYYKELCFFILTLFFKLKFMASYVIGSSGYEMYICYVKKGLFVLRVTKNEIGGFHSKQSEKKQFKWK